MSGAGARPLDGIRVVDFTTGPCGGQATAVLADFGADVLKVEPTGGDRFRDLPSSPFWLRGKQSLELDLSADADRVTAVQLAAGADVVVFTGSSERLTAWGLDAETLRAESPRLVHCLISGFGADEAELPGYEGVVAAAAGRMSAFDVQLGQDRPVYAALPVATHMASQGAVHGIVAALLQRERTGTGDSVETSLYQSLMPFDLVDMLARQLHIRDGRSFTPLRQANPMPTLNYHPLRTADAKWIQCGNLLEHLFFSFLDAIDLLGELLIDEQFQGSPAVWTPEAIEVARDRILLRMQEQTAEEWMARFDANGNVAAEPILTTTQALEHRDVACSLVEVNDPTVGPTTQIGPIVDLSDTPGQPRPAQSATDAATWLAGSADSVEADSVEADSVEPTSDLPASQSGQPLAGVTILDLSTIIAGPLGIAMLADLGARVIKIEPFNGDPFRQLLIEGRMAVKTNAGKESICIDLKTDEGKSSCNSSLLTPTCSCTTSAAKSLPSSASTPRRSMRSIRIWSGRRSADTASPARVRLDRPLIR